MCACEFMWSALMLENGRSTQDGPAALQAPTGDLSIDATLTGLTDETAVNVGVLAVHEVKRLNEDLVVSNEQLALANADLEAFSYTVAHDLRSPIRQIAGFSRILLEEYAPQMPAEARSYLDKVALGAQRMGALVDDLLHLARVGRQPLSLQLTPLDAVVATALDRLQPECASRSIEWRIGSLCSAMCDRGLMTQVFVNLLSNALKYTAGRDSTVIEVEQTLLNDEQVIFVRDNGVGFDMRYAGKLFAVFERLHTVAQFEGTGIGLAIVERIIRRHGGRIWAEAEPDRGATFFFTVRPAAH
jgi:light-regulated signal transduction histidine kinase (bacteriophytochrome)